MRALTHVHVDELVQPLSVANLFARRRYCAGLVIRKQPELVIRERGCLFDAGERDDEVRMMEIGVPVIEKFSSECTVCIP